MITREAIVQTELALRRGLQAETASLDTAGNRAIELIRARTARGQDKDGRAFAPYSRRYARRKGQSLVDLRSKGQGEGGHMMDALRVVRVPPRAGGLLTGREIRLGGAGRGKERLLRLHIEGRGRLPVRDPFGLTRGERRQIAEELGGRFRRVVPRDRRYATRITVNLG